LLAAGNLSFFLWKKLNLEGQYLEDKSSYSSGGNASCSMRDRGSSGVLRLRSAGASLRSGWQTGV